MKRQDSVCVTIVTYHSGVYIRRCLEAELYFYSRIFGFPLADSIMPVPIENLDPILRPAGECE